MDSIWGTYTTGSIPTIIVPDGSREKYIEYSSTLQHFLHWNPSSIRVVERSQIDDNNNIIGDPDTVQYIAAEAFFGLYNLRQIHFGNNSNLRDIGVRAFAGVGLTSIAIPDQVRYIRWSAFANNRNLRSIRFRDDSQLFYIGLSAFMNSGLASIRIPRTVRSIGDLAFAGSSGIPFDENVLTSVVFEPDSQLRSIGGFAFSGIGLRNITIPRSVETIGVNAFQGNFLMHGIDVERGNQRFVSYHRVLYNAARTELIYAPYAISGNVQLPRELREIPMRAFRGRRELTSIYLISSGKDRR